MNELQTVKLNEKGDQIIESIRNGGGELQTIKYGLLRLIGDKTNYRVSFKTLCEIEKVRKSNFTGNIVIPELNMSVSANQIVMLKSETEQVKVCEDFTKRPTDTIILDKGMNISNKTENYFIQNGMSYYIAVAHYIENNGVREYMTEKSKIKRLTRVDVEEGYKIVVSVEEYGIMK